MKKTIRTLAAVLTMILILGCMQTAQASDVILDIVMQKMNEFAANDNTEEVPTAGFLLMCGKERNSGKIVDDLVYGWADYIYDWDWNAYEAGERAVNTIGTMYYLSKSLQPIRENTPINCSVYDELTDKCGGGLTIHGFASGYLYAKEPGQYGTIGWEIYPFVIVDEESKVFENAGYIYFRMTIPFEDGEGEQIQEYILANQKDVADVFSCMLNNNMDINETDRQWMIAIANIGHSM